PARGSGRADREANALAHSLRGLSTPYAHIKQPGGVWKHPVLHKPDGTGPEMSGSGRGQLVHRRLHAEIWHHRHAHQLAHQLVRVGGALDQWGGGREEDRPGDPRSPLMGERARIVELRPPRIEERSEGADAEVTPRSSLRPRLEQLDEENAALERLRLDEGAELLGGRPQLVAPGSGAGGRSEAAADESFGDRVPRSQKALLLGGELGGEILRARPGSPAERLHRDPAIALRAGLDDHRLQQALTGRPGPGGAALGAASVPTHRETPGRLS